MSARRRIGGLVMRKLGMAGKIVASLAGTLGVAVLLMWNSSTVYGTCYEKPGCVAYASLCSVNNCDQPNCGREYEGAFLQTNQVVVSSGGYSQWQHGPETDVCYRSRACHHDGDPCPEDPAVDVCTPSTGSAWTYYFSYSNNIMSDPCE